VLEAFGEVRAQARAKLGGGLAMLADMAGCGESVGGAEEVMATTSASASRSGWSRRWARDAP
jgi:hypothetical protein